MATPLAQIAHAFGKQGFDIHQSSIMDFYSIAMEIMSPVQGRPQRRRYLSRQFDRRIFRGLTPALLLQAQNAHGDGPNLAEYTWQKAVESTAFTSPIKYALCVKRTVRERCEMMRSERREMRSRKLTYLRRSHSKRKRSLKECQRRRRRALDTKGKRTQEKHTAFHDAWSPDHRTNT
jgi:hypothetical protein